MSQTRNTLAVFALSALLAGCVHGTSAPSSRFFVNVTGLEQESFNLDGISFVKPDTPWHEYGNIRLRGVDLSYNAQNPERPLPPEDIQRLRESWSKAIHTSLQTVRPLSPRTTPETLIVKVDLVGVGVRAFEDTYSMSTEGTKLQIEVRDGLTRELVLAAEQSVAAKPLFGKMLDIIRPEDKEQTLSEWAKKAAEVIGRHLP